MRPGRVGVWVARSIKRARDRRQNRRNRNSRAAGQLPRGQHRRGAASLAISPASCLAASRSMASPASPTWGCRSPCPEVPYMACARLSKRYSGRRGKLSIQWHLATHCAEIDRAARLLFGRFWGGRGGCVGGCAEIAVAGSGTFHLPASGVGRRARLRYTPRFAAAAGLRLETRLPDRPARRDRAGARPAPPSRTPGSCARSPASSPPASRRRAG